MQIFSDLKRCFSVLGLVEVNHFLMRYFRVILVILAMFVQLYALFTTASYLVGEAETFEQYTKSFSMLSAYTFCWSIFCIFVVRRGEMVEMMEDLQIRIDNRMKTYSDSWQTFRLSTKFRILS